MAKKKQSDVLQKINARTVHKRGGPTSCLKRRIESGLRGETAAKMIGPLYPGCEVYGFTKGQFCCINILEHVLNEAGPSDVTICTWSAASGDIRAAHRMLSLGNIKSLRFVVDFSFKSRKPQFCQELIEAFGADAIRVTSIHAKFMTVKSDKYALTIRTSMNLNFNPRFENFEISEDLALWQFMEDMVDDIWETQEPHEGFFSPSKGKQSYFKIGGSENLDGCDALESCDASDVL